MEKPTAKTRKEREFKQFATGAAIGCILFFLLGAGVYFKMRNTVDEKDMAMLRGDNCPNVKIDAGFRNYTLPGNATILVSCDMVYNQHLNCRPANDPAVYSKQFKEGKAVI